MIEHSIRLQIVTPMRPVLDTPCAWVTLPGQMGEFQVLPGHTPVLSALKTGVVEYQPERPDKSERLMIVNGFAECGPFHVTLLCEEATLPSEVDKAEEQKRLLDLQKQLTLSKSNDQGDFDKLEAQMSQSIARMRIIE